MDHCLTSASSPITDASHFLAIVLVGIDRIQSDPGEDGCVNKCGVSRSKHVLLVIVVQLDQLCCEPVLPIKLRLQGAAIECGACDGFVNNGNNYVVGVALRDLKLIKV
jgi:hypothetical protein